MSCRIFFRTLLACCLALVTWFNFVPNAVALGGKFFITYKTTGGHYMPTSKKSFILKF